MRATRAAQIAVLCAGLAAVPTGALAAERVGLVLSGGGARGGAHIGVLKVLEELRVPVDYIAGTSMGAIVGGLYSAGHSPEELDRLVQDIDWEATFRDTPERRSMSFRRKEDDDLPLWPVEIGVGWGSPPAPSGLTTASHVETLFRALTLNTVGVRHFDELPIPFRAVAADLDTGDPVVFERGELAHAMRASMSIPAVFTPVEFEGRLLVDGGIAMNLPVEIAEAMGADAIIAVNVGTPPKGAREGITALGVYFQTFSVLFKENVDRSLARLRPGDLLLEPNLEAVRTADFEEIGAAIAAGEAAARAITAELSRFSVSEADYQSYLKGQRRALRELADITIDDVVIEGVTRTRPEVVQRRVRTAAGQPLDPETLMKDLDRVSQAGEFESVGFRLEPLGAEATRLVIAPREKSWGPGYLRLGLGLETNFEGENEFRILGNFRRAHVNRLGAEWKTTASLGDPTALFTELFQPLEPTGFLFVAPSATASSDRDEQFINELGDLEVLDTFTAIGGLDVGVQIRNYGELRLGAFRGIYNADPRTTSSFEEVDRDLGFARMRATVDQIDSANFPRKGNLSVLDLEISRDSLGGDDEYERLELQTTHAWTWGRNTFLGGIELGTDLDSNLPFYREFQLGGFLRLSGFERGQLQGDAAALFTLGDYWQLGKLGSFGKLYLGAAGQAGNTWDTLDDADVGDLIYSGTLYFGVDTRLMPVYLGYGLAEGGEDSAYLFIGRPLRR